MTNGFQRRDNRQPATRVSLFLPAYQPLRSTRTVALYVVGGESRRISSPCGLVQFSLAPLLIGSRISASGKQKGGRFERPPFEAFCPAGVRLWCLWTLNLSPFSRLP